MSEGSEDNRYEVWETLGKVFDGMEYYEVVDAEFEVTYLSERSGNPVTRTVYPSVGWERSESPMRAMKLLRWERDPLKIYWPVPDKQTDERDRIGDVRFVRGATKPNDNAGELLDFEVVL